MNRTKRRASLGRIDWLSGHDPIAWRPFYSLPMGSSQVDIKWSYKVQRSRRVARCQRCWNSSVVFWEPLFSSFLSSLTWYEISKGRSQVTDKFFVARHLARLFLDQRFHLFGSSRAVCKHFPDHCLDILHCHALCSSQIEWCQDFGMLDLFLPFDYLHIHPSY